MEKSAFNAVAKDLLKLAKEFHAQSPSWVIFYRDIFGVGGAIDRFFPEVADRERFHKTSVYLEIASLLTDLRTTATEKLSKHENVQLITIRVPDSLHKVLQAESTANNISMNALAISKLIQPLRKELIPDFQQNPRGRKFGPQKGDTHDAKQ